MAYAVLHHKTVKCLLLSKLKSPKVLHLLLGGAGAAGGSVNMISKVAKKGDSLEGSVGAGGTDNYQRITLDGKSKTLVMVLLTHVAVMGHHNKKQVKLMVLNTHV